ncbi:MAG TPA: glycoside hydrolase family 19 protein [Candidatus Saccharimonadales bacterium]|nr:glycoside hydrolase family 19 protein [Candidatus Saccharimonadales bacterium]
MTKLDEALQKLAEVEQLIHNFQLETATEALPSIVPELPIPDIAQKGLQLPDAFYDYIRGDVGELFPVMSASQFEGIQVDLAKGAGVLPLGWMAYCLATDYHETNQQMQGVKEAYWCSEEWRKTHLRYYPWYGRGKVQLTWEKNYKLASDKLGVDLIANPDKALELDIAASVLVTGMLEGWFTGKKLRDYIPNAPTKQHYINARQIVNGKDKAELIASYAVVFEEALKRGQWL